jgi:hypothetical protein
VLAKVPTVLDPNARAESEVAAAEDDAGTLRAVPYTPDLDTLLTPGYHVDDDGITFVVELHQLGTVVLPTGRVVGCDPLVPEATPFVDVVAAGKYQMRAWVAVLHRDGSEWQRRIAALQMLVTDEPAATWTMALRATQDPTSLDEDEFFGYGVDAGTGTLADQSAIEAMSTWDYEQIEEAFIPAQIPDDPIEAVINKVVVEDTSANVYVVASGWGDGAYATYVGRTKDDRITSFVTDFRVVPLE